MIKLCISVSDKWLIETVILIYARFSVAHKTISQHEEFTQLFYIIPANNCFKNLFSSKRHIKCKKWSKFVSSSVIDGNNLFLLSTRKETWATKEHQHHLPQGKLTVFLARTVMYSGQDSVVGIATRYRLDFPGIESQWRRYFPSRSDRSRGPISLLCNGCGASFPRVKRPGRGAAHLLPSSAAVQNGLEF